MFKSNNFKRNNFNVAIEKSKIMAIAILEKNNNLITPKLFGFWEHANKIFADCKINKNNSKYMYITV